MQYLLYDLVYPSVIIRLFSDASSRIFGGVADRKETQFNGFLATMRMYG